MNDAELRSFCNEMIGKFKMLSDLQKEMQYELIDTKFTEWELKKLIFALDVLRTIADRPTEVIYGNEHNCIMTIFGECSYAETGCGDCTVVEKVRKALSADRPQGEWEERPSEDWISIRRWYCSECGEWQTYGMTNYCPNCGADMRGDNDGKDIQSADE